MRRALESGCLPGFDGRGRINPASALVVLRAGVQVLGAGG